VTLDDSRIRELTAEVLQKLREPGPQETSDLERRVAALERVVRALAEARVAAPAAKTAVTIAVAPGQAHEHPSQGLLGPSAGGHVCVLEPGQPCVGSGQCRTFGH
jgi:hypothetical protein